MKKIILYLIFFIYLLNSNFIFSYNISVISSFLLVISILVFYYKYNKIFFYLFIFLFISFFWTIFSLYYIENGAYISEQGIYGKHTNSVTRYISFYFIFIIGTFFSFSMLNKLNFRIIKTMKNYRMIILFTDIFFIILLFIYLFLGFYKGFPLLHGINRFFYWKEVEAFHKIIYLTPILSFFIGILYALTNKKEYVYKLFILLLLLILFSEKFSGPFLLTIYYIMGFYITQNILSEDNNIGFGNKFIFIYVPIIFLSFLVIVSIGYVILHNIGAEDLYDKIMERALALQGHIWYGIDRIVLNSNNIDYNLFFRQNNEPDSPAGLIYLMYQVGNYDFIHAMRESGIRFTNGFPAITLMSFGYIYGFIIQFFLGVIAGIFLFYLYKKTLYFQPIRLFIALIFFNNIFTNVYIMGEIYFIYKPISIFCLFIFLIDVLILREKNFFKKEKNV
jgi:hypothetical protein